MPVDILIVEDDRALAKSIARALETRGHRCRLAHDGLQATELVQADLPDAIILDLLLPKKDGRSLLRELQESSSTSQVPVIAISGVFRGASHERDLMEAGAQGYLQKPFQLSDLIAHLDAVLPPPSDGHGPERISLEATPVADFVWRWMSAKLSGALQFQRDKLHKVLILEDGVPKQIRSNAARECLGRRLHAKQLIDQAALEESLRRAKVDGMRQGEVLVQLGAVTEEQVEEELRLQGEEKALELLGWTSGQAWVQPGVGRISYASTIESLSSHQMILRGVELMPDELVARQLASFAECEIVPHESKLSPEDRELPNVAALFSAFREDSTVSELLAEHGHVLYALQLIGAVEIVAKGMLPSNPESAELHELRRSERTLQSRTHYQLFELDHEATATQVREKYVELAKRYHPDRFRSHSEDERIVAARVFALISAAHDTLSDPERRRAYDESLRGGPSQEENNAEVRRILDAESLFQRARTRVKQRDYRGAKQVLEEALEKSPEEGEIHALFGWVHFLLNRDDERERQVALEHLERGSQLASASPTGPYYLGLLHKTCGDREEAQRMFRKVLQLQPNHVEASRELRLLEMRKSSSGKRSGLGGLFGFGKKKR